MTDYNNDLEALFSSLAQETEKVAAAVEMTETVEAAPAVEDHEKIAEDLRAGGEILANSFVDSVLEKIAAAVPAAGAGSEVPIASPRSRWEAVAARLAGTHGRALKPGDDTSVRAEQDGALSGAKGTVNKQRNLG
jgi:hypothetical protein